MEEFSILAKSHHKVFSTEYRMNFRLGTLLVFLRDRHQRRRREASEFRLGNERSLFAARIRHVQKHVSLVGDVRFAKVKREIKIG